MEGLKKSFLVRGNNIVGFSDKNFSTCPLGTVLSYAGQTAPYGYLLADGTSYKVADYPDLYAVIGNTYGGDTENFNVPTVQSSALTMVYIIKAFHTNEGVDSGVSDDVINYVDATKELFKYKDISSTCVFKTDAMGSNGKLPKVYKNYNSIVIQWDDVVIDKAERGASYGHIKIPKNSNYDYILNEGFISVVNKGVPKGIVRFFASSNIDNDYLYVSITGDMYSGALETGVDAVRGIITFYFIEK